MAIGTAAAIAIGLGVAGAGYAVSQSQRRSSTPAVKAVKVPKAEEIIKESTVEAKAAADERRRSVARSKTIFTSPLGIGGQADIARKYLLGR